jgi:ABC-type polysaccharide/polyol phosphate export permease
LLFLAWRDFVSSYQGSYLGVLWGLIEPIYYISLTFFFFQFLMAGSLIGEHAYATYVLPPMLGWLVANSGVSTPVGVVSQYRHYLHENFDLRKIAFVKLLPLFVIHVLMLLILGTFFLVSGIAPVISVGYLMYSIFCLAIMLTGLFWLLMSISPFAKDVKNVVGVILQFGFWMSPIFWEVERFPGAFGWVMRLNPFYYPLHLSRVAFNGLHESLITVEAATFWATCLFVVHFGNRIYKRARLQFGDVL